jgi:two-component system CheB/CheR fusion protein
VNAPVTEALEGRFLILAPVGRDAPMIRDALDHAGLSSHICTDAEAMCAAVHQGAAGVLIVEEALAGQGLPRLASLVDSQPAWSDLPILLLTAPGADSTLARSAMQTLGNVTLLERPVRVAALVSAVRSARRARERQYQIRSQIAERDRIADALRRSERLYRAIGESIDYGVWVCDADGRNTYASEAFLRLVGITQEQCSEFGWAGILHPDDRTRTLNAWKACVREGGTWDIEHRVMGVDGRYHAVLARGIAVRDEHGAVVCWAGINLDIARLKQAEASLREADRRKDEFLATLAHELRNPLAPIRNAVEVLRRIAGGDPKLQWCRDVIDRQVRQMGRLVDDLLDVSRITLGKIELRRERITLADVVRAAVETVQPAIDAGAHVLSVRLPGEPILLDADPVRMSQALSNLLSNAAKYTSKTGHLGLHAERSPEGGLTIRVTDDGIGIDPLALPHVFGLFSQSAAGRGFAQGGLGIGLSLVRSFVEMHGGRVEARSEGPGKGSEFIVRLPGAMVAALLAQLSGPAAPAAAGAAQNRRVLVVEDSGDGAEALRQMLECAGHDVRVGRDGLEAVELAEQFRPQVILMDLGLPRVDGYEATRRIRQRAWAKGVLVVAMTGWGQEDARRRSIDAGCDRHLVKPVDPAALLAVIGQERLDTAAIGSR